MKRCLELAEKALAMGNPPVGSIIIHKQEEIGVGIESGRTSGDVTRHAEILAIRMAVDKGYKKVLSQSTLYTTHEPCIMCSYPIRHYRIPLIVMGIEVAEVGGASSALNVLTTSHVSTWKSVPEIIKGVCKEECEQLNQQFSELLNR